MTSQANGTATSVDAMTTPAASRTVFQTSRHVEASPRISSALPPLATRMTRYASGSRRARRRRPPPGRAGAGRASPLLASRQVAGLAQKLDRALELGAEGGQLDVGALELRKRRQAFLRLDSVDERILGLLGLVDVEALARRRRADTPRSAPLRRTGRSSRGLPRRRRSRARPGSPASRKWFATGASGCSSFTR